MNMTGSAEAAAHCGLPDPLMVLGCPHESPQLPLNTEQTHGAPVSCYSCSLPGRPVTLPRPLTAPVPPSTPSRGHRVGGQQRVWGGQAGFVAVPSDPLGPHPGPNLGLVAWMTSLDVPQEDMRLALVEGRRVLESIHEPLARSPDQSPNQDQLDSQSTVHR